jgi:hypothetical protein
MYNKFNLKRGAQRLFLETMEYVPLNDNRGGLFKIAFLSLINNIQGWMIIQVNLRHSSRTFNCMHDNARVYLLFIYF